MISAFSSLINYEHDDWEEYLSRLCLYDIFKPLIKEYPDKVKLTCAIRFILYCYSIESEKVILGSDWQKNKQRIFEDTCTPMKDLYEDLVLLKNQVCVDVINRWVSHQDSDVFAEMTMLKDLQMELMISATSRIMKSSGEIDYTQKYLNSTYVTELRKKIKDLENEFIQNNAKMKEAIKDFKVASKKKNTLTATDAFKM